MRTEIPTSSTAGVTLAKVRAELGRARRRFLARPPAMRWSIGLSALAAVVAMAYAVTTGTTAAALYVPLRSGMRFSADDVTAIQNAFDIKHISYRIDRQNRVEVAADQHTEANDAYAKLNLGPRRIADILRDEVRDNPWESLRTAERREAQSHNEYLERLIQPIDGDIVNVTVKLRRPDPRLGPRGGRAASAFVWVETENGRKLSVSTVEKIQSLIANAEPEIKHDAVAVFDHLGRGYLDANDQDLNARTRNRARQEELQQEILERLDWLKGVQVSVQLVPGPAIPPPTPLPPLPAAEPVPTIEPAPSELVARAPTAIGVNQPLELPDQEPTPPAPATAPVLIPAPPIPILPAPPLAPEPAAPKARVLVQVPRSYYRNALADRKPSGDELQALTERTTAEILKVVRHLLTPGQLEEPVVVSTFPDDLPVARSSDPAPESRRAASWWMPAGVAAGATVTLMLIGFRVLNAARPPLRPIAMGAGSVNGAGGVREDRGRYKLDEASDSGTGPGPSERVRELIRLNPEAAASVLQRWTGQGGSPE